MFVVAILMVRLLARKKLGGTDAWFRAAGMTQNVLGANAGLRTAGMAQNVLGANTGLRTAGMAQNVLGANARFSMAPVTWASNASLDSANVASSMLRADASIFRRTSVTFVATITGRATEILSDSHIVSKLGSKITTVSVNSLERDLDLVSALHLTCKYLIASVGRTGRQHGVLTVRQTQLLIQLESSVLLGSNLCRLVLVVKNDRGLLRIQMHVTIKIYSAKNLNRTLRGIT